MLLNQMNRYQRSTSRQLGVMRHRSQMHPSSYNSASFQDQNELAQRRLENRRLERTQPSTAQSRNLLAGCNTFHRAARLGLPAGVVVQSIPFDFPDRPPSMPDPNTVRVVRARAPPF